MLETLRWAVPATLPAVLAVAIGLRPQLRHQPRALPVASFVLGAVAGGASLALTSLASRWTGLDVRSSVVGEEAALLFLFCLVAPVAEITKVVALWPAFRSHRFTDRSEGVLYASLVALGFASVDIAAILRAHPAGLVWIARALLALPAHVFFASFWGYALGRAKEARRGATSIFPVAWVVATVSHGLYLHIVFGRGPGALVGVAPLLLAMGGIAWVAGRDLRRSAPTSSAVVPWSVRPSTDRFSRNSFLVRAVDPPSLHAVRESLRKGDEPIKLRWIALGALVTLGAMVAGLSAAIAVGHALHVDFSVVDEHDAATTAPLILLGVGLLAAFPVSGFLIARASNVGTLLEPALGAALAILGVCAVLGLMAPIALVFAFAFSPVAFCLSCAGAWAGLPTG